MIDTLTATQDAQSLIVGWDDGKTTEFKASFLRREARDAWSIRERIDHGVVAVKSGIQITDLVQIGAQGVNIHFSDGHEHAIYPFSYLRELSDSLTIN